VDVDFDQLIWHVDGIMTLSADVRKGRFGVYGDIAKDSKRWILA
jgi:hypothetical protein